MNENINELIVRLDPDFDQCPECKKFFHKNVLKFGIYGNVCYLCSIIDEIPIKKIEECMFDFEKQYWKRN